MPFADASAYPYRPGSLFLGLDPATNREVGVSTERHAITIAGAGMGKGAALLIPNALRWPGGLLVVDPKGEVAEATWQAREAMGQQVAVLDPYRVADVPDRLRAKFNPLAAVDPSSLTAREDLRVVADGLVKRHRSDDEEWYAGAVTDLAGVAAYVIENAPPEQRTFRALRNVLMQPDQVTDDEGQLVGGLYHDAQLMQASMAFGGLARAAGVSIQKALQPERSMDRDFLGGARRSTDWMDSPAMQDVLSASTFDLGNLKAGRLSLFLVLPPKYLGEASIFLRLFVRLAINQMMQDGVKGSGRCLMLLDEFYALGRLDIVAEAAGLMRGYGLSLWPFMQDLSQLSGLYQNVHNTFFANSDASIFFGNSDVPTLRYVSDRLGNVTAQEVGAAFVPPSGSHLDRLAARAQGRPSPLPAKPNDWDQLAQTLGQAAQDRNRAAYDKAQRQHSEKVMAARAEYDHRMTAVGTPRLEPAQIADLVGKKGDDKVARSAIVFAKGGDVLNVRLQPYFAVTRTAAATGTIAAPVLLYSAWTYIKIFATLAFVSLIGLLLINNNPTESTPWFIGTVLLGIGVGGIFMVLQSMRGKT